MTIYLRFNQQPIGLIPITEYVGYDVSSFTIEREAMRYGADITYANDEVPAIFWKGMFEETDTPTVLPDGTVLYQMTMGYEYLLQEFRIRGFEMDVDMILEKDGTQFIVGELDGMGAKLISDNSFSCKMVTQGVRASMRRDAETKINLLGDKDVNDNPITPIAMQDILINAIPTSGLSEWKQPEGKVAQAGIVQYFNYAGNNTQYGVKTSLVPFDQQTDLFEDFDDAVNNFKYIRFLFDSRNIEVRVDLNYLFRYRFITGGGYDPTATIKGIALVGTDPYLIGNLVFEETFYEKTIATAIAEDFTFNDTLTVNIPFAPKDYILSIFWILEYSTGHLGNGAVDPTSWVIYDQSFTVKAVQTALDSVASGARWIDVLKQTVKNIVPTVPVNAAPFDVGGEHYDNFVFDGNRMRGFTEEPFLTTWNEQVKILQEPNCDVMVTENQIFIDEMPEFYRNEDMGGFVFDSPVDYETSPDEEYALKLFTRKYRSYETDKDESNSKDVVHGLEQKRFPNIKPQAVERILDFPHARDPILQESTRRKNVIVKPSTSLAADNMLFYNKCIELAPASFRERGGRFSIKHNSNNTFTILNRSEDVEPIFGWDSLGFGVGDPFFITGGNLVGSYVVLAMDTSAIIISPTSVINPVVAGELYIQFKYFITGVLYQTAFNQGYALVDGLENNDEFGNLDYTFGRMGVKWYPYWAAVAMYHQDGIISTREYKNNGKLRTQKAGEPVIVENGDLVVNELGARLFDPVQHQTRLPMSFDRTLQLLDDMETKRGFIRIQTPWNEVIPVFIRKFENVWALETAEVLGLQKAYIVGVTITGINGALVINGTTYTPAQLATAWFEINNGYLQVYDVDNVLIVTPILFNEVVVNGVTYSDENDFRNVLLGLI